MLFPVLVCVQVCGPERSAVRPPGKDQEADGSRGHAQLRRVGAGKEEGHGRTAQKPACCLHPAKAMGYDDADRPCLMPMVVGTDGGRTGDRLALPPGPRPHVQGRRPCHTRDGCDHCDTHDHERVTRRCRRLCCSLSSRRPFGPAAPRTARPCTRRSATSRTTTGAPPHTYRLHTNAKYQHIRVSPTCHPTSTTALRVCPWLPRPA